MEIKIELEYVENLKQELQKKEARISELESELAALDPEKIKKDAVDLAEKMFEDYISAVFVKLGFTDNAKQYWGNMPIFYKDNLKGVLGHAWHQSERFEVNIGANISNKFRRAFMELGIKTNEDE